MIRDYLALMGDASDNVPGVPKVGPKTAVELLNEYGDIDNLYANLDKITKKALHTNLEAARENLKLSRELVTLQTERSFSGSLDALEFHGLHSDALADIFKTNEINSLLRLLEKVPSRSGWTPGAGEAAPEPEELPAYELVNSDAAFEQMNAELSKALRIAVDTETDGLDSMQCKIVGLNLCGAAEKGYYIPLGHTDDMGFENGNYDFQKIRGWFLGLWKDKSREWIFHNAKFDLHVLSRAFDFEPFPAQVRDTLIAAWLRLRRGRLRLHVPPVGCPPPGAPETRLRKIFSRSGNAASARAFRYGTRRRRDRQRRPRGARRRNAGCRGRP